MDWSEGDIHLGKPEEDDEGNEEEIMTVMTYHGIFLSCSCIYVYEFC
jgi:hypothetical protein